MARLYYSAICSLDGYTADEQGNFAWAAPDSEVHQFVNDLERPIGTYLYGRRMYEVMAAWETMGLSPDESAVSRDFAQLWRGADKIVFSRTLRAATSSATRIERTFDPTAIQQLKAHAARDLSIGGPELAALALRAGLVDECSLLICPVVVGGGTRALPERHQASLRLEDQRRFASGVVYLRYAVIT